MQNDLHQQGQKEEFKELRRLEWKEIKAIQTQNKTKRLVQIVKIRFKYIKLRNELRNKLYAKQNLVSEEV